jgi:D-3-phosphoglycerate dehydrogenase / 2-oxoglutarate reductase
MDNRMAHRILVSDGLSADGLARLGQEAEVSAQPKITPADLLQALPEYDALIVRSRTKVTAEVLQAGARLKVVGRAGVGVDNIDVAAAAARGVVVVNSPLAATVAVAEITLGLMLALARAIPQADAGIKRGEWLKSKLMGAELHGNTLGLLGVGRIGAAVAERAIAFGMVVLAYDPYLPPDQIRARGAEPAALEDVLARSDYISTHLPLSDETRGMLGASAFASMKRGVRLIAAARGGVVDEAALLDALESGQVAGAGLDVYAHEPVGAAPLAQHPLVVCTPHIGAQTEEAQARAGLDIAEEVLAALAGRPLRWQVHGAG